MQPVKEIELTVEQRHAVTDDPKPEDNASEVSNQGKPSVSVEEEMAAKDSLAKANEKEISDQKSSIRGPENGNLGAKSPLEDGKAAADDTKPSDNEGEAGNDNTNHPANSLKLTLPFCEGCIRECHYLINHLYKRHVERIPPSFTTTAEFEDAPVENLDGPLSDSGGEEDSQPGAIDSSAPSRKPGEVSHVLRYRHRDRRDDVVYVAEPREPFDSAKYESGMSQVIQVIHDMIISEDDAMQIRRLWGKELKDFLERKALYRTIEGPHIKISSRPFLEAFRKVVDYYPNFSVHPDKMEFNKKTWIFLLHHREKLKAVQAQTDPESELYRHMSVIFEFVDKHYGDTMDKEAEKHKISTDQEREPTTSFESAYLLFPPGTDVCAEKDDKIQGFVVKSIEQVTPPGDKAHDYYTLVLWYLAFDGSRIGRVSHYVDIPYFVGDKTITSLSVVPMKYHDYKPTNGNVSLRRRLEERGEKWFKLLKGRQMDLKNTDPDIKEKTRVYVDTAAYYREEDEDEDSPRRSRYEAPIPVYSSRGYRIDSPPPPPPPPNSGSSIPVISILNDDGTGMLGSSDIVGQKRRVLCPDFRFLDYDHIDPSKIDTLEDTKEGGSGRHRYFLCTEMVHALALQTRSWEHISVDSLDEARINSNMIDHLVLKPAASIDMIKGLVHRWNLQNSRRRGPWTADYVQNKGEGQIFLLHGPPGVGKTFTAECIAEHTGRPLLSLTCGDIGTNETRMEAQLSRWFKLAESWDAVLLIDEADVYLERRSASDLNRNSLVSVFLRAVEYYRGILFLTTNRVGHFDDAFISRIHFVLQYNTLDKEDRRKIWEGFFEKVENDREDVTIRQRAKSFLLEDPAICDVEWNGREIRNIFQTAVALAEYQAGEGGDIVVDKIHFQNIIHMSKAFKKYLQGIDEQDESARARNRGDRIDK